MFHLGPFMVWDFHMPLHVISLFWSPFLHVLVAYHAFVFGLFTVLKIVLFWPIHHVSLRVFGRLVNSLHTSCYSLFWASFSIAFLACLYTVLGILQFCKYAYFWSLFNVVEGNFSGWAVHIPLASLATFWPVFLHKSLAIPMFVFEVFTVLW